MINLPDEYELDELRSFRQQHCLSIYVPLIDSNTANNPNRIELKNLLREAETALTQARVSPKDIEATLEPARHLLKDHEFWPPRHESLVLFLHPKLFRYYHLPDHTTPYLLTVETGFNLEPLLEIMKANRQYFVLALSHKNVRFYEGDRYQLKRLRLKSFPTDMKQALGIDEYPLCFETHSIAPTYVGKGSEAFHGQYNIRETDKEMLMEFFRLINKRLRSYLRRKKKPLLIMGVNYLLPIYQLVNTSALLMKGGVAGNFEYANLETIHRKSYDFLVTSNKL